MSKPTGLNLRDEISSLRKQRDAHQMDESDYVESVVALIERIGLDLIGEDAKVASRTSDDGIRLYDLTAVGANKLRSEQRSRLKKIVGGSHD